MTRCAKLLAAHGLTEGDVAPPEQPTAPLYVSGRARSREDARLPLQSSSPIPTTKKGKR
ncbi:hypothetical protein [Spongiactinospora sp. TRM90649]|uniref:hypothetical protein n=1 Tax=Spongiactinospora sp. TRM90649 TaxID=3031114 RepID=UPI0023FA1747|nr:hypothetical protein [Spongiactinospora sp. TRM90649]MDF5759190.1 hypothetical protein [Spongiactinospora sp. TRM90649]